ncbi:restriction endonuclease subunit S [Corynebacterium diphtheriae]
MKVSLREVSESIKYGLTASATIEDTGYKFLRITDIANGSVDFNTVPNVELDRRDLPRYQLEFGDIVIARTGASTGAASYFMGPENVVFASYLVRFRIKPTANSRFVSYVLRSETWKDFIYANAFAKSAQPNLSANSMSGFEFDLPDFETQRAIADVLGALDDKIAANQRVIQLSEQLAMTFYRSTEKSESSLTFADVAGIYGGGTPSTKNPDFWDGEIRWATPTDITALKGPWLCGTARSITEEGLSKSSGSLHPEGSILMTSRATIGHVAFIDAPTTTNQGFINLVPQESYRYWLYFQLKQRTSEFIAWANGATFLELSRGTFKKLPFQACAETELEKFNSVVAPLMKRVLKAQKENQVLAATRDELLPLLMNGKITVAEAKEAAGDVGVVKQNQQEEGDGSV